MSQRSQSTQSPSPIVSFAFLVLLFFAVFIPVISTEYLYHDDWYVFVWDKTKWTGHPIFGMLLQTGRPVGAIIHALLLYPIDSLLDATFVRGFLILLNALCALIFVGIWRKLPGTGTFDAWSILLITALIFLCPTFQTYVGYVSNGLDLVAVFLSFLSSYHILRTLQKSQRRARLLHFTTAIALCLASLATYPPAAMFPWIFFAISLLQSESLNWRQHWPYLKNTLIVFGTAGLIYRLYSMTIQTSFAHLTITQNVLEKSHWYLKVPVWQFALNPWGLSPSNLVSALVSITIALGLLCPKKDSSEIFFPHRASKLFLLLVAYFFACLPMVVSAGAGHAFRSTPGLYVLTGVVLLIALDRLFAASRFPIWALRVSLLALLCVSIFQASYNTNHLLAGNISLEYRYIKSAMKQVNLNDYRRIHIIKPDISQGFVSFVAGRTWGDEFGVALSTHPQDICPMMISVFRDLGIKKELYQDLGVDGMKYNQWNVSFGTSDQKRDFAEPTLTIDMLRLRGFN